MEDKYVAKFDRSLKNTKKEKCRKEYINCYNSKHVRISEQNKQHNQNTKSNKNN